MTLAILLTVPPKSSMDHNSPLGRRQAFARRRQLSIGLGPFGTNRTVNGAFASELISERERQLTRMQLITRRASQGDPYSQAANHQSAIVWQGFEKTQNKKECGEHL